MPTATGPNGEKLQLENGKWVPVNTPQEKLAAEQALFSGTATDRPARMQGIKTGAATVAANVLSIPHAIGELLPSQPEFLRSMPNPDAKDVLAAVGALPQAYKSFMGDVAKFRESGGPAPNPYTAIGKGYQQAKGIEDLAEAEHPVASTVGRTAGDVATMLTLRPSARVGGLLGLEAPAAASESAGALSKIGTSLLSGGAKMVESGFDAASLAAMGEGDPGKAALYGAGIQGLGSAALGAKGLLWSSFRKHPANTVLGLFGAHEVAKSILPGPQEAYESKDQVMNELAGALVAGTLAHVVGASRPVGPIGSTLSSASRAAIASGITQAQEHKAKAKPTGRESKLTQLRGLLGYDSEDEDD